MASAKTQRPHHFSRPPGGRPEQKARQAEGEGQGYDEGVSSNAWFMICRMVRVSACLDAAARRRPMTLLSPSRPSPVGWSSLAHHPLEPTPPCSSMLGTQRSPLPSSPLSPLLLTSSSGADHPSPPLRTPSSVTFPCSCLLLPQISGIDCALDSSGPVRQTRHMSWRAATSSTSAVVRDRDRPTRLRCARCGWRPGNRRQGECDGKSPLVSHHEGSRGGEEDGRHAQPREAPPPPGPN